jgi:branched-chain amino acid transport system substrate-binding protein
MAGRSQAWASALVAVVALSACGGGSSAKRVTPTAPPEPPATIEIAPGQPLKIGVSVALTGDQASLGWDLADAVELAARAQGASIKGHAVRVIRMDDGCSNAERAVGVARSLADDRAVAGVVGPMCTTGAQAADGVYDAAHVVHIVPAATRIDLSQQGEGYFFRTAWLDDAQAHTQAEFIHGSARATAAVLIDDTEPYGKALADEFAATFAASGGSIASRERIERGTTDFGALVRKVKSVNPDAVVFEGLNPEGALLVQALRSDGYAGWFMAPDGVFSAHDFIESVRDKTTGKTPAEGAVLTGGPTPDDAFVAKFRDAFQRTPSTPFVLQAHDAATALLRAIEAVATEGPDGALMIDRARLAGTLRAQVLTGLTGVIHFDERGDRSGSTASEAGLAVYKVVDGRFQAQ